MDIKDPSIDWRWTGVGVLDWDPEQNLWLVQKLNREGRVIDGSGLPVVNAGVHPVTGCYSDMPTQYWIPRVQLMFLAEDPNIFAQRVAKAYELRAETEALLRYYMYLDCMPIDALGEVDRNSLTKMIDWAKGTPILSKSKK